MILAADIGGTKSLLALLELSNGQVNTILEKQYPSKDFTCLEEILELFLAESQGFRQKFPLEAAGLCLAGPIDNDSCKLTNLNWTVRLENIQTVLPAVPRVTLCNDLVALGRGLSILAEEDLFCLTPDISPLAGPSASAGHNHCMGSAASSQNKAVLAPGTGLGESIIIEGKVYPSEGAHCEFGPRTAEEVRLWCFLHQKFGHVSYERLLSGPGLKNIYAFLLQETSPPGRESGSSLLQDPEPEQITGEALARNCPYCVHALEIFLSVLGAEAGNLALRTLALGGIYLGGGILPQILPALTNGNFLKSFRAKGRFSGLMRQIPVYVILNNRTALYGAVLPAK